MERMTELVKKVDINWIVELCHKPGARLDYMQEQITLKYNSLTANEAKKIILLVALSEASIIAVKELNKAGK